MNLNISEIATLVTLGLIVLYAIYGAVLRPLSLNRRLRKKTVIVYLVIVHLVPIGALVADMTLASVIWLILGFLNYRTYKMLLKKHEMSELADFVLRKMIVENSEFEMEDVQLTYDIFGNGKLTAKGERVKLDEIFSAEQLAATMVKDPEQLNDLKKEWEEYKNNQ